MTFDVRVGPEGQPVHRSIWATTAAGLMAASAHELRLALMVLDDIDDASGHINREQSETNR